MLQLQLHLKIDYRQVNIQLDYNIYVHTQISLVFAPPCCTAESFSDERVFRFNILGISSTLKISSLRPP